MLSTAVRSVSSSPWRSRRHFNSVMTGYDRIEKTYVRRRKTAPESPPGSELAMASLSHPTSPPSEKLKTCADCRTSMTPLWRRGPDGPKSLCNACGIRYRRKKPMGNEGSGSKLKTMKSSKNGAKEGKEGMVVLLMQHRSKEENGSGDYGRQEAEAALLLMALSSGLFVPS